MGGIWFCIYDTKFSNVKFDSDFIRAFSYLQHRGKDNSQLLFEQTIPLDSVNKDILRKTLKRSEIATYGNYTFVYGYHRLAINDASHDGHQPFEWIDRGVGLRTGIKKTSMCNGEIYNWRELVEKFNLTSFESENDCEVILHLFNHFNKLGDGELAIKEVLSQLDGEFAFVITSNVHTYDIKKIGGYVARDPLGLKSLYYVKKRDDSLYLFVSELKGIPQKCVDNPDYIIGEFPPGHYWSFQTKVFTPFWSWNTSIDSYRFSDTQADTIEKLYVELENELTLAITKRLPNNGPFGITLSGGIDSAILVNLALKLIPDKERIYFFTIGDSRDTDSDIHYARKLIRSYDISLEQRHHILYVNDTLSQDTLYNYKEIIAATLETEDPMLINECIPFFMLYHHIHKQHPHIKVMLSGDGCSSLFGQDKKTLSLRIDKMSSLYGIETRLPYLDLQLIEFFRSIHPQLKREVNGFNKYILRKSNEVSDQPLPKEILYRQSNTPFVKIQTN